LEDTGDGVSQVRVDDLPATPAGAGGQVMALCVGEQKFDGYCDKLSKDYDFGKVEAIVTIGKLKAKPEQARAAISIGVIIGAADSDFDADERQAVKEACFAVGIAPSEFDL